jgi:hypothetical protein
MLVRTIFAPECLAKDRLIAPERGVIQQICIHLHSRYNTRNLCCKEVLPEIFTI